jgi:hypothetical protein
MNKNDIFLNNGRAKRASICANLNWEPLQYYLKIREMYVDKKMSAQEIADYINQNTPNYINITARSIQRSSKYLGISRTVKEAFNNAVTRNRVKWAYKESKFKNIQISSKLRYEILKRDNFKCSLCGATAETSLLEVDHIKARAFGGDNSKENLRTLCHHCNVGKRIVEKEM